MNSSEQSSSDSVKTIVCFNNTVLAALDTLSLVVSSLYAPVLYSIRKQVSNNIEDDAFILKAIYFIEDNGGFTKILNEIRTDSPEDLVKRNYSLKVDLVGLDIDLMKFMLDGVTSCMSMNRHDLCTKLRDCLELLILLAHSFQN